MGSGQDHGEDEMVIIRLMGGLGNQLQQYALYEKYNMMGRDVRLDTSWFRESGQRGVLATHKIELGLFPGIRYKEASGTEIKRLRGSDGKAARAVRRLTGKRSFACTHRFIESAQYHPEIFDMDDIYLEGFWACEKYYSDIMPELRRQIVFPDTYQERRDILLRSVCGENGPEKSLVSMHIRRGDYLDNDNRDMFAGICTQEYYDQAERYIRDHVKDPYFLLFSDDIGYAREHYTGPDYTVIDLNHGPDSYKDIGLMSVCDHHICANSTFSFWGARLDGSKDKIQIRPSIHKNSQVCVPEQMHEWWQGWTIITPKGELI